MSGLDGRTIHTNLKVYACPRCGAHLAYAHNAKFDITVPGNLMAIYRREVINCAGCGRKVACGNGL